MNLLPFVSVSREKERKGDRNYRIIITEPDERGAQVKDERCQFSGSRSITPPRGRALIHFQWKCEVRGVVINVKETKGRRRAGHGQLHGRRRAVPGGNDESVVGNINLTSGSTSTDEK